MPVFLRRHQAALLLAMTSLALLFVRPLKAEQSAPNLRLIFSHHREGSVDPCG